MDISRITFIWNADFSVSGGINALKEVWSGEHSCSLCEIAYHRVTQTKEWKNYKTELSKRYDCEIRQPCKNQISKAEYAIVKRDYPAVLAHTEKGIIKLLGGRDVDSCNGEFSIFKKKLDDAITEAVKGNDVQL